MKKKQFQSLCHSLLPNIPGFSSKEWLLFASPIDHVLKGFCGDDSGLNKEQFTVWAFMLPLYVPTDHVHFNMGFRLTQENGCEKWWNIVDPDLRDELLVCIETQGLPYFDKVKEPKDVATAIQKLTTQFSPYDLEAVAYSQLMAREFDSAGSALERLISSINSTIAWQARMADRAEFLLRKLNLNPQLAIQQLHEWELATLQNLGL